MSFLPSLDIAGSGMTAQKRRLDVISENIANRDTLRTEDGTPYYRKLSVFREVPADRVHPWLNGVYKDQGRYGRYYQSRFSDSYGGSTFYKYVREAAALNGVGTRGGVALTQIFEDTETPLVPVYDPNHPDADEEGYRYMPNVDTTQEMLDAMAATRSYSANIAAFEAIKKMATDALQIGK
jgi:flagellar basal-body rod protein FlgC